jgi:hypothetical protein
LLAAQILGVLGSLFAQSVPFNPAIPKTWDESALSTLEVPLAQPAFSAVHVPAGYYYRIPERPVFKSYPVRITVIKEDGASQELRASPLFKPRWTRRRTVLQLATRSRTYS